LYSLKKLLEMSISDKEKYGVTFTPSEINQQPEIWNKTADIINLKKTELIEFIARTGVLTSEGSNILITGAGTSEFVGNSVASMLQGKLGIPVNSVSTTDFIINPKNYLLANYVKLVISIARSGDSPESVATYRKTKIQAPDAWQMVITCNKNGKLAEEARIDPRSFLLVLPEETNDKSLAMTSSFSSMVLSLISLSYLESMDLFNEFTKLACSGAKGILDSKAEVIREFIKTEADRVLYLGSGELKGAAQEAHLKILEMTDGRIVSKFNTYTGLRHGPQVFANGKTLVVAFLSGDRDILRYELDLLKEMQEKKQGKDYLFVCQRGNDEIRSLKGHIIEVLPDTKEPIPAAFRVITDIVVGQLAGLFKSLQLGLKPDAPSSSGTINRVVKGITIYGAGYDN